VVIFDVATRNQQADELANRGLGPDVITRSVAEFDGE